MSRGRAWLDAGALRVGATCLVGATFAGSLAFVIAHPKNPDAPLRPPVPSTASPHAAAPATSAPVSPARRPPRITLAPAVRATELPGVTFTHVS
jgi:hypothetical protein